MQPRAAVLGGLRHFAYVPLLAVASALAFAKLIVYAQMLGAAPFGALTKMLLISTGFGFVGSLGMQSVASRDLPALIACGRQRRGVRLLAHTLGVTALAAAFGIVLAAAGMPVFDLTRAELALGVAHGLAQQVFLVAAFDSRSRLQMMRFAGEMTVRGLAVMTAGAAVAAAGGGALGIVIAEAAVSLLLATTVLRAALRRAGIHPAFALRAATLRRARLPWATALTLLAGALVLFVSSHLDRWIAAEALAREPFGQYAFAWLLLIAAQSVQALLNSGVLPRLARRRALGHDGDALRITAVLSLATLLAGAAAFAPALWLLGLVVRGWMPAYAAALVLLPPLLLAALFRVADFWSSLALVRGQEARLLRWQSASVLACGAVFLWVGELTAPALAWLAVALAITAHLAAAAAATFAAPRT